MPAPNLMAAYLAAETRHIPIGIIGNALPLHGNPLRVAEEVAQAIEVELRHCDRSI